jgi:hypothetical protein
MVENALPEPPAMAILTIFSKWTLFVMRRLKLFEIWSRIKPQQKFLSCFLLELRYILNTRGFRCGAASRAGVVVVVRQARHSVDQKCAFKRGVGRTNAPKKLVLILSVELTDIVRPPS